MNSNQAWVDLNNIKDGSEAKCQKFGKFGIGNGKPSWYFNVGLIKGLLQHIRQYRHANRQMVETCERNKESEEHTIVFRGIEYRNVRCAVCLHERSEYKRTGVQLYNRTVKKTSY